MIINDLKFLEQAAKDFAIVEDCGLVINLIKSGNPLDLLFFERLKDPKWLPILKASGLFSNLPVGEVRKDGTATYSRSTALIGLFNLSKVAPIEIIKILEELEIPVNPAIKDQLMGVLAEIDEPAITDRVLKVASRIIRTQPRVNHVWIEVVLEKSVRNKYFDDALEVINSLLDVTLAPTELHNRSVDTWQIGEIDRNIITPVSEAKPVRTAQVIFSALLKWAGNERSKERATSNRFLDSRSELNEEDTPSCYWLEDFHGSVIGSHELEAILAYRLFNIGSQVLRNENLDEFEEFDSLLRSNPWNLFSRVRWQLYADHPKQTLKLARNDILARISRLSSVTATHGYEMAQMLEKHSEMHRDLFLKPDDVQTLCARVQLGPLDDDGQLVDESAYQEKFQLKQLYPIRCLLEGKDLEFFNRLRERVPKIRLDTFKPFSSGGSRVIENVPPKKALEMPAMSDTELWDFLNNWVPNPKCPDPEKWWIEEDVSALGVMFAEFLESTPDRFPASTEWWKNLKRPSVLLKPLDRATNRILETVKSSSESGFAPTDNDWRNWFGLAAWITQQRNESPCISDPGVGELEDWDWNWPCIVVVKFLSATLKSKFEMPSDLINKTGLILQKLIQERDKNLENKDKPWIDDWLTTAINSVRGSAVDGLLQFSLFHKRKSANPDPEGWIYDLIISRLQNNTESPAVFAIIGSHLRLMLYLFYDQLKFHPECLLPSDRKECCNTLIISHIQYDNPMPQILDALPCLPDAAIDCLSEMNKISEAKRETRGDFGARLGTHLGFYYWNAAFANQSTADAVFDRYFATAKPKHRAAFIRDVARIFESSTDSTEHSDLACKLWDRRFNQIKSDLANNKCESVDVDGELSAFIDWLGCECFSFDWRLKNFLSAVKLIKKGPSSGFIIRKLEDFSSNRERLHACLEILGALLAKDSGEIQWSYPKMDVSLILKRGFSSTEQATRNLAMQIQDELLRYGLFEYLELNAEPTAE